MAFIGMMYTIELRRAQDRMYAAVYKHMITLPTPMTHLVPAFPPWDIQRPRPCMAKGMVTP